MTLPPVAFVGLGAIGAPMAAHLAEGGRLTVWNRTRAVAERFAARHQATVAATPRDAAAAGELVLTCLPTSREVEAVLDGPDGLLAGFRRGALLIDCTRAIRPARGASPLAWPSGGSGSWTRR